MAYSYQLPVMEGAVIEPEVVLTKFILTHIKNVFEDQHTDGDLKDELKKYIENWEKYKSIPWRLVKRVHDVSKSGEKPLYLHELLSGSDLHIPERTLPPRDPELEARIQKLRAQQDNREYRQMTRNVEPMAASKEQFSADFGKEIKDLNRHIWSALNFIITVGGAFAFGYKSAEYAFGGLGDTFLVQMVFGLFLATVVFFADLYFLIKKMS